MLKFIYIFLEVLELEYKIFKQKSSENINYDFYRNLKEQFDISYLTALLLNIKGFTTFGEVETYLNPKN